MGIGLAFLRRFADVSSIKMSELILLLGVGNCGQAVEADRIEGTIQLSPVRIKNSV
jgi:hypothetical protein